MERHIDVRILKIELADIAEEYALGENALIYIAQLEEENEAFLRFATLFYKMGSDAWPKGAWNCYQCMPTECARNMDALAK